MNRIRYLNWKGIIRMKYSLRLKEMIISIFHNSRISEIHVIFTKVDFHSTKAPFGAVFRGLRWRLVNILCVIWPYSVFNTIIFGFGNFLSHSLTFKGGETFHNRFVDTGIDHICIKNFNYRAQIWLQCRKLSESHVTVISGRISWSLLKDIAII